jgi:hypothetical protein
MNSLKKNQIGGIEYLDIIGYNFYILFFIFKYFIFHFLFYFIIILFRSKQEAKAHFTFIDYEPVTGNVLRKAFRPQINLRIERGPLLVNLIGSQDRSRKEIFIFIFIIIIF